MLFLKKLFDDITLKIKTSKSLEELNKKRIEFLGKNSYFSIRLKEIKKLDFSKRKSISLNINIMKKKVYQMITNHTKKLENLSLNLRLRKEIIDVSLPGRRTQNGTLHPITIAIYDIESFFYQLGFNIINGPEIENEYYNFDALNIPKNHPARHIHDTFWFDANRLLRTQTSNMQIRVMEKTFPPLKVIVAGKVYRNDYDITHTPMFHQIEGLVVGKQVNFANLKWIIFKFLNNFFKKKHKIRFRSSYFPFTVPSAEVDILWGGNKWLEVLGCGMVHPNVLKNVGIDSKKYSAYAFGIGIERIVMLRHNISDIRSFFENDVRFIKQFK